MESLPRLGLAVLLVGVISLLWRRKSQFQKRSRGFPLPPGPKPLPVLGNLLDIPQHHPWKTYLNWTEKYVLSTAPLWRSDMVYVEALGNTILILNNMDDVNELFVKRATIYSNRPTLVMLGELMELDKTTALLQYGPTLREHRKLSHAAMSPEGCKKYTSAQEDAVAIFVDNLVHNPKDFYNELRLTAGRIIMSVVYGIPATTPVDVFLDEADKIMKVTSESTAPGAFIVDLVPILKYLPSWFPFNNIHSIAKKGRDLFYSTIDRPFEYVKQQRSEGVNRPSCTADFMRIYESETGGLDAQSDFLIKLASGSMFGPGSETTYASALVFIHAMALFPKVQQKIQDEIESVVGHDRLPNMLDRPKLPYLNAAIKETFRWRPVTPTGIARRTNVDDHYKGYFIPSGTIVFPNIWAISRDMRSGISPEEFAPERFMTGNSSTDATDPYSYIFGFGRRECPGQYLADNSLFFIISWMMATSTISKAKDSEGKEKPLDLVYGNGMISFPEPFEVDFEQRNIELASILKHHIAAID